MKLTEKELRKIVRIEKKSSNGKTLYGICPKCGKNEFGISTERYHPFGCFRKKMCGWTGDIFDLFKFLNLSFKRRENIERTHLDKIIKYKEEKFKPIIEREIKMPIGFRRVFDDEYLNSRHFLKEDYNHYCCGYSNLDFLFKNRIIIGLRQHHRLVTYTARSFLSKEECEVQNELRYRNYKATRFELILDGLDEIEPQHDTAIIVEGVFDRVSVKNQGDLKPNECVISTLGVKMNEYQTSLLGHNGIKHLVIFYDPDVIKQIIKIGKEIFINFESVKFVLNEFKKDPGDMNKKEINICLNNRINLYNFTHKYLSPTL